MASHSDAQKIRIIELFLKIGYMGSFKFSCYYLQHVRASKRFDHTWFEVLEAIALYCTWSENKEISFHRTLDKFSRRTKLIWITGESDDQCPGKWSFTAHTQDQ